MDRIVFLVRKIVSYSAKSSKGSTEILVVLVLLIAAVALVGGVSSAGKIPDYLSPNPGITAQLENNPVASTKSLQLQQPKVVTLTMPPSTSSSPTPGPQPSNNEPEIMLCPSSSGTQTVTYSGGQIIIWVQDESPPYNQPTISVNGGAAHTPDSYKGTYGLYNHYISGYPGVNNGQADTNPCGVTNSPTYNPFVAEFIWNVSSLGIAQTGSYTVNYTVYDGDGDQTTGTFTAQLTQSQ